MESPHHDTDTVSPYVSSPNHADQITLWPDNKVLMRSLHYPEQCIATDGNTMYMFGGSLAASDRITNDVFALDLQTWIWSQPPIQTGTTNPPPVRDHQCIMVGDQLLSLLGFNTNGAPASATPLALTPGGTDSPVPPPPPIYVLSTSAWSWSTQFTALPGTPRPPSPPSVSTDGSKGKVNGVAIGFGVVFGLAFAAVIGFQVYSHRRRKQRKADTLLLIEMEQRKKDDEKLEKDRRKKDENSPLPAPPSQPYPAHLNGSHMGGYEQDYYSQVQNGGGYYPGGQDPFQDPGYHHQQQMHLQQMQHSQNQHGQFAPNQHYAQAGAGAIGTGAAAVSHERNPFDYPTGTSANNTNMYSSPHMAASNSQMYVPEEMGSSAYHHAGHGGGGGGGVSGGDSNVKVPVGSSGSGGGLGVRPAGDKMSFVDSSSAYR